MANEESHYMNNGCFLCLINDNNVIGTIAIRKIDDRKRIVELKKNVCVAGISREWLRKVIIRACGTLFRDGFMIKNV